MSRQQIIKQAYRAFNQRDIDAVLLLFHTDVHWPNGWEGGYVHGYDEIRDYWTRQWAEVNPVVEPVSFRELPGERIEVGVEQLVKDLNGSVLFDGILYHTYFFEGDLIRRMEISDVAAV